MGDYNLRDLMNAARRVKAAERHFGAQVYKCTNEELVEVLGLHFPDLLDLALRLKSRVLEKRPYGG